MATQKNNRLVRALLQQSVDTTPIWMMRQAGRYLPEYRDLRAKAGSFIDFCKQPEQACQVTLQPLQRFDLDAAIIFSDILTVVDALGFNLEFVSGVGPVIHDPVQSHADLETVFALEAIEKLNYVYDAIRLTVRELDGKVPLIGFAGSPWTVSCYLIDGQNRRNEFQLTRKMLYQDPELLRKVLSLLTEVTINYINGQIEAGAEVVMLFDSWGGILPTAQYYEFSLNYMQKIGQAIHRQYAGKKIPLIFFTKSGGLWLERIAAAGCDGVGLDWTIDIGEARSRVGGRVALQGNLDPCVLLGSPQMIRSEVARVMRAFGRNPGHIFNLGHGIHKETPIENIGVMIEAAREFGVNSVEVSSC